MSNEYVLISFYGIQINVMKALLNKTYFFSLYFLIFIILYSHMDEDVKYVIKPFYEEINKTLAKLCWIPIANIFHGTFSYSYTELSMLTIYAW